MISHVNLYNPVSYTHLDPLRAKYIAETYLENPVCFNTVRNMFGYTGTYKGEQISVMGSGMGCHLWVFTVMSFIIFMM